MTRLLTEFMMAVNTFEFMFSVLDLSLNMIFIFVIMVLFEVKCTIKKFIIETWFKKNQATDY